MFPLAGITCFCNLGKKNTNEVPYYRLNKDYVESIEKCGGMPFIIPLFSDKDLFEEALDIIDGLIVTGGKGDSVIGDRGEAKGNPRLLRERDEKRYVFERYLIEGALKRDMPLLGICRGMQMLCEVTGGKISPEFLNEIDTGGILHKQKEAEDVPTHMINLQKDSKLQNILGVSEIKVNSFHIQFCVETGKDLKISAWARKEITEAIESPVHRFALGLQFHPERMFKKYPTFLKIFKAFLDKCQEYHNSKNQNKD